MYRYFINKQLENQDTDEIRMANTYQIWIQQENRTHCYNLLYGSQKVSAAYEANIFEFEESMTSLQALGVTVLSENTNLQVKKIVEVEFQHKRGITSLEIQLK